MLRQRVLTALVLVALFLAAVLYLPLGWLAVAFALVATAGAWEWSALAGLEHPALKAVFTAIAPLLMLGLWYGCAFETGARRELVQPWIGLACFFWSIATLLVEGYPRGVNFWRSRLVRALMGWFILSMAWLSALYLLSLSYGSLLMVLLVIVVAASDIGAYFTGRRFGSHKLAPAVSPGKTWEGLWGGVAAVIVVIFVVWASLPMSFAHLDLLAVALLGLAMAGASVVGDLTVSMVKRVSGVKDSGSLLPGHGGVLDRLDSVCGAGPVFVLGLLLTGY